MPDVRPGSGGWLLDLLVSPHDKRILGVRCIGPHASELVHLGNAVMALGGTVQYFVQAVFNYPTLGEAYKHAAYHALEALRRLDVAPVKTDVAPVKKDLARASSGPGAS